MMVEFVESPASLPEGTVTVLFTDVVGSAQLPARLGEGPARRVLREVEDAVRAEVVAHGGREVKQLGDGMMVAFSSARRAVDCAIAIQRGQRRRSLTRGSPPIELRIGLNTGEVIRERDDLFGSAVNVAKRIEALAKPGGILISATTRALLGAVPDLVIEDRGQHDLKGFAEPWQLFEVTWAPAVARSTYHLTERSAFVGREAEIARLIELLERARSGRGSMVLLGGEAGVGKSRLAEELARVARDRGVLTLVGHCRDLEARQPYLPFMEMVERALALVPSMRLREVLGHTAPEVAKLMPELRRRFDDIPEAAAVPPDQERRYLLASIREFVARAAAAQPLVMVFEDLHWGDEATLLLVRRLCEGLDEMRALILATYRDTELELSSPFAHLLQELLRERLAAEIMLSSLGRDDVAALLELTVGEPPPERLVSLIYDETEGNPFFVEELVRHLAEVGRLFDAAGHWNADITLAEDEVPRSVRLVIGRRLERLSEACRSALTTAAHIGRVFDYELLAAVEAAGEDRLVDVLEEAERAGVVREVTRGRGASYTFSHEQVRQVLLRSVSTPRGQRIHRRVGEALEGRYGPDAHLHAAEIASHFFQAGAAVESEKTTRYLLAAAQAALDALAYEEALWALDAARSTQPESDSVGRSRLLHLRALALRGAGRVEEALATFESAIALADPGERQDRVLRDRAELLLGLFRGDSAVHDFELLVDNARRREDGAAELEALLGLAYAYYEMSLNDAAHAESAFETLDRSFELARARGDKVAMTRSLLRRVAMTGIGPMDDRLATRTAVDAVALAEETGDEGLILECRSAALGLSGLRGWLRPYEEIRSGLEERGDPIALKEHYWRGMWLSRHIGEFELCVTLCDCGIALADRLGVAPVMYPTIKALALLDLGRYGEAAESLAREVVGEPFGAAMQVLGQAAYLTEVSAFDRGAEMARRSAALADEFRRPWMKAMARSWLIRALLGANCADAARSGELTGIVGEVGGADRAEILLASGDASGALEAADSHLQRADRGGLARDRAVGGELRARVLMHLDRVDDAAAEADRSVAEATATGFKSVLWRAHLARARAREPLGDTTGAETDRVAAARIAGEVGRSIADAELREGFLRHIAVACGLD